MGGKRRIVAIAGGLAFAAIVAFSVLRAPAPERVSISLLGYTNVTTGCWAVLQITNHSTSDFIYLVGPRFFSGEKRDGRRPPLDRVDRSGVVRGHQTATFWVFAPEPSGTNLWRVPVQCIKVWPIWYLRPLTASLSTMSKFRINPRLRFNTWVSPEFSRPQNRS
jgi:hypothetical protein